jgi:uncharacterized Fe-S cluster-containing protein
VAPAEPRPLDGDRVKAIRKAKLRERVFAELPLKDCGVCGAPDCRTLADDIARGYARLEACPFIEAKPRPKKKAKKEKP